MIENTVWMTYSEYLPIELRQSAEEGKEVEKYRARVEQITGMTGDRETFAIREKLALNLLEEIEGEPVKAEYPYKEPDKLDEIRQLLTGDSDKRYPVGRERIKDKVLGAWTGRCIGCLLGQPIEGWKRERIVGFLKDTDKMIGYSIYNLYDDWVVTTERTLFAIL